MRSYTVSASSTSMPKWSSPAARAARVDVEADIAVAHRDGAAGPRLLRGLHAEDGAIELLQQRIVLADDGDVIDFREHYALRGRGAARRRCDAEAGGCI